MQILCNNMELHLISDFNDFDKPSLCLMFDLEFNNLFLGESTIGPGAVHKVISLNLKKLYLNCLSRASIYKSKDSPLK